MSLDIALNNFNVPTLHDFQQSIVDEVNQHYQDGIRNVGVKSACGSGKTIIGCELLRQRVAQGQRCLFIVDRIELVKQTSQALVQFGINHSLITAGWKRFNPNSQVWVAAIQTLARLDCLPTLDFVVIDEFHTVYKAYELFTGDSKVDCLGLSATPFTKGLGKVWTELVLGPSVQTLIDQGFLVPTKLYHPFVFDVSGVPINLGEFNQRKLAEKVNVKEITADVVETWMTLGNNRKTIGFTVNTDHAHELALGFQNKEIACEVVDHHTELQTREDRLRWFKEGGLKIIINCDILTKGFNDPSASCMIDASPTWSLIRYHQRQGRIQRTSPGKEDAIVLDHAGNCSLRHGLPTDPTPDILNVNKRITTLRSLKPNVRVCPKCDVVKQRSWGRKCHICLYEVAIPKLDSQVNTTAGVLINEENVRLKNEYQKKRWYEMLVWHANYKGYKTGWAAYKYKNKWGEWPTSDTVNNCNPTVPNDAVANYIKFSQRRKKVA